jgi:Flp pilus assembly protein TadB
MRRPHVDQPALITSAPESNDDEYDRRRKRYAVMMGIRALCVIGAATTYHLSMALALCFVVAGLVLPWCAVLIANDRPPKKHRAIIGHSAEGAERALPAGADDRTVDN